MIFLTGHGDIAMAVDALKAGAFDFVEKPFNDESLVARRPLWPSRAGGYCERAVLPRSSSAWPR